MKPYIIDIHAHPSLKPFTYALKNNDELLTIQNPLIENHSMWKIHKGILNFYPSQICLQQAALGGILLIGCSIGSLEREFFKPQLPLPNALTNYAVMTALDFKDEFINRLKKEINYWQFTQQEITYLVANQQKKVRINDWYVQYRIINRLTELEEIEAQNSQAETENPNKPITIGLFINIEGIHALQEMPHNANQVLASITKLKQQNYTPWYLTLCHHFYNGFFQQARSIPKGLASFYNQSHPVGQAPILPEGFKIIDSLWRKEHGKRILIDIKHMNYPAREAYYAYLKKENLDLPIFVSHGVCNGQGVVKASIETREYQMETSRYPDGSYFYQVEEHLGININDINFYNHELKLIADSKGLFGLQLDEKRITNRKTNSTYVKWINQHNNYTILIARQLFYIVEYLDRYGVKDAWDYIAFGSDYDGIIRGIKSIKNASQYPRLIKDLTSILEEYITVIHSPEVIKGFYAKGFYIPKYQDLELNAAIIIKKITYLNAFNFFKRWQDA